MDIHFTKLFVFIVTTNVFLGEGKAEVCFTDDGRVVQSGVQVDLPGRCEVNKCVGNNTWVNGECGYVNQPPGWGMIPEDKSGKVGFPQCCAQVIPPLDIVPDVLDEPPGMDQIYILYPGSGNAYLDYISVIGGNHLLPYQVQQPPWVDFRHWADPNSYYLLAMVDPDSPFSHGEKREILHWMIGNIPGAAVNSGEILADYMSPEPQKNSGFHRYFFMIFKQPGQLAFDEPRLEKSSDGWRMNFSTKEFIRKYNLGYPEAVNGFLSYNVDRVPTNEPIGLPLEAPTQQVPVTQVGCFTEDGRTAEVGEQVDIPGQCQVYRCLGNNKWLEGACGIPTHPPGWSVTLEDRSGNVGYPNCCPKAIPPLNIVPDILDEIPGTEYLDVVYAGNIRAEVGKELTPTQVKDAPKVDFKDWVDPYSYYLLAMVDPDSPHPQGEKQEVLHWMIGNMPGSAVHFGEVLADYMSPEQQNDIGHHRYFFMVFKQPAWIPFILPRLDKTTQGWRVNFSTRRFARLYNLGEPVAVNAVLVNREDGGVQNLNMPLPSNLESQVGCLTEDGRTVNEGVQVDIPGQCQVHQCLGNNEWLDGECGYFNQPPGWGIVAEDKSGKVGYPQCCSQLIPPLDIVPDVLDELPGQQPVDITYSGNVTVTVGNDLTPSQVNSIPLVDYKYWADPDSFYILIMTDPDAPGHQNPQSREFLHWMVGNIPGSEVNSGEVIANYMKPEPAKDTGSHRYFFMLFRQPGRLNLDEERLSSTSTGWREGFSSRRFAEKYKLGTPEAVNAFKAKFVNPPLAYEALSATNSQGRWSSDKKKKVKRKNQDRNSNQRDGTKHYNTPAPEVTRNTEVGRKLVKPSWEPSTVQMIQPLTRYEREDLQYIHPASQTAAAPQFYPSVLPYQPQYQRPYQPPYQHPYQAVV